MSKPKLLIYSDAGQATGFEKITRNLCAHLHEDYEITIAGIGFFGQVIIPEVKVIPATLNPNRDFMGLSYVAKILSNERPDVILIIQDVWNAMPLAMSINNLADIPLILYTMPDSPNIKWIYGMSLSLYDAVICPTEFGIHELAASCQAAVRQLDVDFIEKHDVFRLKDDGGMVLNARTDRLQKYQEKRNFDLIRVGLTPIPDDYAAYTRTHFNIPLGKYTILNVNTNSFRKRLDLTLVAFKRFLAIQPDAQLVLHCQGGQQHGWDIRQLISLLDIQKNVIYSTKILTEAELFGLYNCADVQINTSSGEGWGLPSVEGYTVGTRQLVPNWSATKEIWNSFSRISTKPHGFHYSNVNTLHGRIDIDDLVDLLEPTESQSQLFVPVCNWDATSLDFNRVIRNVFNSDREPIPTSVNEIIDSRVDIHSRAIELMEGL